MSRILFRVRFVYLVVVLIVSWASGSVRAESGVDPLSQVSGASPFATCTLDYPSAQPGVMHPATEVEPWVAVNPANPLNVVGIWQQDRWSNGGARGLAMGVSFDGGVSWTSVVPPGLTRCGGGPWYRVSDPWVSFAPNGDLHLIGLTFNVGYGAWNGMTTVKSTDGGLTWGAPVTLALDTGRYFHDKESITADPTDANMVYAVWDRVDYLLASGPAVFTRSTNAGATWEPIRVIHDPGPGAQTLGNQIVVLPDGTVLDFFTEIVTFAGRNLYFLAYKKSADKGVTWWPASEAARVSGMIPANAVDPDRKRFVRDGAGIFDVAVDPRRGWLYAVWQDGDVAPFRIPAVAFTMSKDGGATWSKPIAVNRTPTDLPPLERQSFLPSVHVTDGGAIGVSYYDFRFNGAEPQALTDHWLTWCHPQAADCTDPTRWREELRLTDLSFDLLQAPVAVGLFLGDYVGLGSAGNDFIAFFTQTHDADRASAFARRVVLQARYEPQGMGFWKHQVVANITGRGRVRETAGALGEYLEDIRGIHDQFDGVTDLAALRMILDPPPGAGIRARAAQHLMALLLNVTSSRVAPWVEVSPHRSVADAIDAIVAVIEDPAATRQDLEAAKDLAEAINGGEIPLR